MSDTTAQRDASLDLMDSGHYLAFVTAVTDMRAGTFTEASYTGYARVLIPWAANVAETSGRKQENSTTITGATNSGAAQALIGAFVMSAISGGVAKRFLGLGSNPQRRGYVDNATTNTILLAAHGYSADQHLFVQGLAGEALPAGLSENVAYYVGTVPDSNRITLSTTAANANPVDITALGPVKILPYTAVTIDTDEFPEVAANALRISA